MTWRQVRLEFRHFRIRNPPDDQLPHWPRPSPDPLISPFYCLSKWSSDCSGAWRLSLLLHTWKLRICCVVVWGRMCILIYSLHPVAVLMDKLYSQHWLVHSAPAALNKIKLIFFCIVFLGVANMLCIFSQNNSAEAEHFNQWQKGAKPGEWRHEELPILDEQVTLDWLDI